MPTMQQALIDAGLVASPQPSPPAPVPTPRADLYVRRATGGLCHQCGHPATRQIHTHGRPVYLACAEHAADVIHLARRVGVTVDHRLPQEPRGTYDPYRTVRASR
jgi:hypothetical protein